MMKRKAIFLACGTAGAVAGLLLTGGMVFIARSDIMPTLLTGYIAWGVSVAALLFSLAEIPLMLYAIRSMASGEKAFTVVIVTAAVYTFSASVYATIPILLGKQIIFGLFMSSLGLLRLALCILVPVVQPQ